MHATLALRLALSVFMLIAGPFFAPAAAARTVTSLADAGPGTLRAAIEAANAAPGADKILFAVSGEITLLAPLPEVADALTLIGGGQIVLRGQDFYENALAMLRILPGVTASIRGMTIIDAVYGGIDNRGSLTVQDCSFKDNDNQASWYGGAINNSGWLSVKKTGFTGNEVGDTGGAIYNTGTLLLQTVRFEDNLSHYDAGAIFSNGVLEGQYVSFIDNEAYGDQGGALMLAGTARFTHSTFEGNQVHNGGGAIWNNGTLELDQVDFRVNGAKWGGAIFNWTTGKLTVTDSTFSNNGSAHHGGAIDNAGTVVLTHVTISDNLAYDLGGGLNNDGTAHLTAVTLEGNQGGWGGAIGNSNTLTLENSFVGGNSAVWEGGGLASGGSATIRNSTFSGNTAEQQGGAISNFGSLDLAFVTLAYNGAPLGGAILNTGRQAVIANAVIAAYSITGGNCTGAIDPGLGNLADDDTCVGFDVADPRLAPLATISGTQVHYLRASSPAIDRLPPGDCGVSVDQRAMARPQGPACDSGAIEVVQP